MANLLPQNDQMTLRTEQVHRFHIVVLLGLAATVCANAVFLFPSFLSARGRAAALEEDFAMTSRYIEEQEKSDAGTALRKLRDEMGALLALEARASPKETLRVVSRAADREQGVFLSSLAFETGADGASTLSVRGTSETREALLSFGNLLEETEFFGDVAIPVSSLARSTDIDFTLALTLVSPQQ